MDWKAVCLLFISCYLSGLHGRSLHIILTPDEASHILTREAQVDFNSGVKKFLKTKVDVQSTSVHDANGVYDIVLPASPQDIKMEKNKRSEVLLGKIKNLLNDLSAEKRVSAFSSSRDGLLKDGENSVRQTGKSKQAPPALPPKDANSVKTPRAKEDSLEMLEKMVDNLVNEIQTERKRGMNTGLSVHKRQKIPSIGREAQTMTSIGREEYPNGNVGQETLNRIKALQEKLKKTKESERQKTVWNGLTNIRTDLTRTITNDENLSEQDRIKALQEKLKKAKESENTDWNDLTNIGTELTRRITNDDNLVESTAEQNRAKALKEAMAKHKESEKQNTDWGRRSSKGAKTPKDRRALMKELLDTYNEMMGKGNKRTDKYAKELEVESKTIIPKQNSDNSNVSKETAKVIGGFSVISNDKAKKEPAKSVSLDASAEDIINKAREMLNQGFSTRSGPK